MTEQTVTYTIQLNEKVIVVEHVPARACISCGERLYSPDMGERLQKTVWEKRSPSRMIQTAVYNFAEK